MSIRLLFCLSLMCTFGFSQQPLRLINHITPTNSPFETLIRFQNHSSLSKSLLLTPFSQSGSPFEAISLPFEPLQSLTLTVAQLFPGTDVSHFLVSGSEDVQVLALFRSKSGEGAQPVLSDQVQTGKGFWVFSAQPNPETDLWEGFALVNLEPLSSNVEITRIQDDQRDSVLLSLDPGSKQVQLFSSLFPARTATGPAPQYHFRAQRPISLTILGGTNDLHHMWILPAEPSPRAAAKPMAFVDALPSVAFPDPLNLISAAMDGDLLHLDLEYSTTCNYEMELLSIGEFMESLPVQIDLYLHYIRPESGFCIRQTERQRESFDLAPLAQRYRSNYGETGEIRIRLFDIDKKPLGELLYRPF